MYNFLTLYVFFSLALITQALYNFCSCSDFKFEHECLFPVHQGVCIWDNATSSCSDTDCDSELRKVCENQYTKQHCVTFNSKCQNMKAACADYTSETILLNCPIAGESFCEVDIAAESKKCKKRSFTPNTCKDFTTKPACDSGSALKSIGKSLFQGRCYFDESKDPKCLDSPNDCSATLEAGCNASGCVWEWKEAKCVKRSCSLMSRTQCGDFQTNDGMVQFCKRESRTCVDEDFSENAKEACHIRGFFNYHFDGSCKSCIGLIFEATNSTNSTDSYGLTLVNSLIVGIMALTLI